MLVASCGGKKQPDSKDTMQAQEPGKGSSDAPKRAQLTPRSLSPVIIRELGGDGAVPGSIVVELAAAVVDRDQVGASIDRKHFKITPSLDGALTHTGVSELTFTPGRPFAFDTQYTFELTSVDTLDGDLGPAAGETWTYSFKTPPFKLLGWAPTQIDLTGHKISMDLAFSGPVLPNLAKAAMSFTLDGAKLTSIGALPGNAPGHMVVVLSDPRLAVGSKLGVSIAGTLVSLTGTALAPTTATYIVSNDKAVSIKAAAVVEGANGFYLEVVCDDSAAAKGNRGYYAGTGYYGLSQRCQLTDDAIKHVHFEPEIKKAYVTGGRAGFRVFGELKRGVYKVKIDGGATTIDGGVVMAPFTQSFSVPARKPVLSFASTGRYLPRTAWTNLGIKHVNVDSVNLVVRQVPAENLVFWLGESSDAATERTSDLILKKTIPLRGDFDAAATSWLDVAQLLPATTKGVLELKLVGVGTDATSRLLLTNLSLVAKKSAPAKKPGAQTVQVWALDMDSAEPQSDVEVSLVRKSGKAVAKCLTKGADGCTLVAGADNDPDDALPFALIARKGDDLTYLRYQDLHAEVAESSTSGAPYIATTPYRAAIYPDRGVYRPGETAHVVAIVRDVKDRAPEQPLPVNVEVFDPHAKVVRKLALRTNAAGEVAIDQAFPAFADTGNWRVAMSVADAPLVSHDLQVEEFVPERMKVDVAAKADDMLIGSKPGFVVAARYLFGGSAVDSGVELTCTVEPERFTPAENADLTYGVLPKGKPVALGQAKDQLDPTGRVTIACPEPPSQTTFTETARLTATASVLEAGSGRATVASASATLHPEKYYIGVRTKAARAASGETFTVEGMVVDWNGKPAPAATGQLHVDLHHLEADYGLGYDEESGESRYDRWLRQVPEGKLDVKVTGGKFSFDVTPGNASAGFLIKLSSGKARTELVLDGESPYEYYGYGDGNHSDQTPRPAKPTQIAVKLPALAKIGEDIKVSIRSPYKGKVLWAVETDHVVTAAWQDIAAGDASWSFKLDAFVPNVYVSAFIVKDPHLESKDAFLPDRAFGLASLKIAPTDRTQAVTLTAPKEIRSSSPLAIT
ncbi:MAG TPA: MG2 domain-containing protein, partial [Kofleriaceae bacterium]